MPFVFEGRDQRRFAVAFALTAFAAIVLLLFTARAQAAETIFWDNYRAEPETIGFANIDGSAGGALNTSGASFETPEGMAYDTVTNRLFVGTEADGKGQILYINLDGSGAGALNVGSAPLESPEGVAVNPVTRMIYWVNTGSTDSIGFANLDGSGGGQLNTSGAVLEDPYKVAIDPVAGKVYWGNTKSIGYANADNTGGGGVLNTTGAPSPESITGLSTDPAGGRVYWLDNDSTDGRIGFASLAPGGNGGEIKLAGSASFFDDPYGLAFDPSIGRLYYANYGQDEERAGAIGFANLSGGFGGITISTAPLDGPQDPVVIKSPGGTGVPTITRDAKVRATLSCSEGTWGADYAGSFVYQAPRSFAYQWTRNGATVPGATAAAFTAVQPGSYACTVTATNQVGSTAQASAAIEVKAAKFKLKTKKKAKADAGDLVTFKLKAVNQGDLKPKKNAKLCVKLPKGAKDDLKAPKCKKLALNGGAKKTLTLKVKVKPVADEGTAKLTFQVKGSAGKAAKSKIVVR
jgi:DNA-binding beta-propeller fold protein YncE